MTERGFKTLGDHLKVAQDGVYNFSEAPKRAKISKCLKVMQPFHTTRRRQGARKESS